MFFTLTTIITLDLSSPAFSSYLVFLVENHAATKEVHARFARCRRVVNALWDWIETSQRKLITFSHAATNLTKRTPILLHFGVRGRFDRVIAHEEGCTRFHFLTSRLS